MTLDNLRTALILNNKMLLDRLKIFLHQHDNLEVLNGLSENEAKNLLFKGSLVNEQYEVSDAEILQIVNEVMSELDKTLGNGGSGNENPDSGSDNPGNTDNPDNNGDNGDEKTEGGNGGGEAGPEENNPEPTEPVVPPLIEETEKTPGPTPDPEPEESSGNTEEGEETPEATSPIE